MRPFADRAKLRKGFLAGLAASGVAGVMAVVLRLTLHAPAPPEALVDWVTFVVPLDVFSAAVEVMGVWAKRLLVVGLSALFIVGGGVVGMAWPVAALRFGHGWRWLAGASLGSLVWLLTMAVVLPASGRGFFGLALRPWPVTMALAWLVSSLAYGVALAAVYHELTATGEAGEATVDGGRRRLVRGLAWGGVGLVAAAALGAGVWRLVSRLAGRAVSLLSERLPPEVTPNDAFYTVSINFIDPRVEVASWTLEVTGLVERNVNLSYEDLIKLPSVTQYLTLECISNPVGGASIGNALWRGVRLRELLSLAGVKGPVRKVVLHAADGYSDSITLDKALEDGTVLAHEMNGVPLPQGHGFPARLLVPGIYGMKNVKWLTRIELVDYDYKGYWQQRGWSDAAVIKTMSRIDLPSRPGEYRLGEFTPIDGLEGIGAGGERTVDMGGEGADEAWLGGIAFGGDRGVSRVEVSTDGGQTWSRAQVKEALSPYTWVLWVYGWRPPGEGAYTIMVRAADGQGSLQTQEQTSTLPDGASGYHSVVVRLVRE